MITRFGASEKRPKPQEQHICTPRESTKKESLSLNFSEIPCGPDLGISALEIKNLLESKPFDFRLSARAPDALSALPLGDHGGAVALPVRGGVAPLRALVEAWGIGAGSTG